MSISAALGICLLCYAILVILLIISGTKANRKFDELIEKQSAEYERQKKLQNFKTGEPKLHNEGWVVKYVAVGSNGKLQIRRAVFQDYAQACHFYNGHRTAKA